MYTFFLHGDGTKKRKVHLQGQLIDAEMVEGRDEVLLT